MKNFLSLINLIIMLYIKSVNLAMRYLLDQQSFSSMLYLVSMVPKNIPLPSTSCSVVHENVNVIGHLDPVFGNEELSSA